MGLYVRSRLFCCCLRVRLGVLVMSLITLLLSLAVAISGGVVIAKLASIPAPLPPTVMIVLWVIVVYYGIVAAVSIFGFIGCLLRKPAFISVYNVALWTLLALDLISFIITLYHLYRGDTSEFTGESASGKAIITVLLIAFWTTQLYGCYIVKQYVGQLLEERLGYGDITPWPKSEGKEANHA